jgi:hypothetical protein
MAIFANTSLHAAANELNISAWANMVEVSAESDEIDVTTFSGGGYRQKITGLGGFSVNVTGFQDFVAPAPGVSFPGPTATTDGALTNFSVAPSGDTVGNVAYFGQSRVMSMTDLAGSIGEAATFTLNAAGTSRLVRGIMLHPVTARTVTGTGTAFAFTMPTATQSLHMVVHVHSVTGSGTFTPFLATDDAIGFPSATTRLTSTAFTAIGSSFSSVAGAIATDTHARIGWTISGFTSVTFSCAAGVGVA